MPTVTAYTDAFGDLVTRDTGETLRRATRDERRESDDAARGGGTGAIAATVAERTLRRRAPAWCALRAARLLGPDA